MNDPSAGVTYRGVAGAVAVAAGGRFVAGTFVSNRTRETRAPARAEVALPVYVNAESDSTAAGRAPGVPPAGGIASLGTCH